MAFGKEDSAALTSQAAGTWAIGTAALGIHPTQPEGVWAVIDHGDGEHITMVFPTELAALRTLNGRNYGRVAFLPFGKDLHDLDTEEVQMQKLRTQLASGISSNKAQES